MLTLEQMNRQWEERQRKPLLLAARKPDGIDEEIVSGVDLEEIFDEYDDEDDEDDEEGEDRDTEADLNNACDLLHQAMDMLCAMADRRKEVTRKEKREMIEMAEEIFQYLDEIGDITEEDR